jgi:hypothetical protein
MSNLLRITSLVALIFILISALLCAGGNISSDSNRMFILVGTIIWFVITPMWLRKNN